MQPTEIGERSLLDTFKGFEKAWFAAKPSELIGRKFNFYFDRSENSGTELITGTITGLKMCPYELSLSISLPKVYGESVETLTVKVVSPDTAELKTVLTTTEKKFVFRSYSGRFQLLSCIE